MINMTNIANLFEVKIINNTTGKYLNINDGIDNTNNYSLVTVVATDFNNQPVVNKNLTISCDKGKFSNNNQSYTGTTDNDGKFEVTYLPTEWGLCTLSCDVSKCQFLVKGFKQIPITSTNNRDCTFQVNELTRHCKLLWYFTNSSLSLTGTSTLLDTITFPKQEYYPINNISKATYNPRISFILSETGNIYVRAMQSYSTTMSAHYEYFEWHY